MNLKENLTKQLAREEGRVAHAYQDHLGYWTIGIGRLIDKRIGGRLRDSEIDFLLSNDIDEITSDVAKALPWFSTLDDARKGALISMAFQMGVNGLLGFKNTLEMVRQGRYSDAAAGMLNSLWAKQTPDRAKRMSEQMRTGRWQ